MRLDAFKVALAGGVLFAAGIVWADANASRRQERRAKEAGLATAELKIEQMNCAACRGEIMDALRGTSGVGEITAERRGATIAFDPGRVSPEELVGVVRRTGYDASLRRVIAAPAAASAPPGAG